MSRGKSAAKAGSASPSVRSKQEFDHPLASRYASAQMVQLWSAQHRYATWRRVWLAAARAQHRLGLPVTARQIRALEAAVDRIDFAAVAEYEHRTRHEVVAHLRAYADAAPSARPILHLGLTSMDVVDNADLVLMRNALELLEARLAAALRLLSRFARRYADLPTLGWTHLQPAQPTTVGKRATLWLDDLLRSLKAIAAVRSDLACRGLRGATGTQASFLSLLGSAAKVRRLETLFARELGFRQCYPVTGQTYSRQVDIQVLSALAQLAAAAHKCCLDLRLLAMLREIEEPFEPEQVGSSAMPYKRNPMRCERVCGLARYLISLASSTYQTLATQMLERTLDDSSNRRLVLPEAFLAADAIAVLLCNIFDGLVVYPAVIAAHLSAELPFLATEEILLAAVSAGGDRQMLHERLRRHARAAAERVKRIGGENDLLDRLRRDPAFAKVDWQRVLDPRRYIGLAAQQTRQYLREVAGPALRAFRRPVPTSQLRV